MELAVEGPKGKLSRRFQPEVRVVVDGGAVKVERSGDSRKERSVQGLTRRLVANMVEGVSSGFSRKLEINGVGYRADVRKGILHLALGYSHPILYQLPEGVQAAVENQTLITISGVDREKVGAVAAEIRKLRPPEPYKGKGVKYAEETIRRKAGKAGAGA